MIGSTQPPRNLPSNPLDIIKLLTSGTIFYFDTTTNHDTNLSSQFQIIDNSREIDEEVFALEQYKKILDYPPRPGEGAVASPAIVKDCFLFTPSEKREHNPYYSHQHNAEPSYTFWEKDQHAAPKPDSQLEGQPLKIEKILGFPPPPQVPIGSALGEEDNDFDSAGARPEGEWRRAQPSREPTPFPPLVESVSSLSHNHTPEAKAPTFPLRMQVYQNAFDDTSRLIDAEFFIGLISESEIPEEVVIAIEKTIHETESEEDETQAPEKCRVNGTEWETMEQRWERLKDHFVIGDGKEASNLSEKQRQQVTKVLRDHVDVFVTSIGDMSRTDIIQHSIKLKPNSPPTCSSFQQALTPPQREFMDNEINAMLRDDVIV
ncbi:hypothetical protein BT69DRAFT_1342339 [Atractiella rhizophila]|nr:hypothetical protein BT69DRAFT_1342339 [Atractiella rhizophila]